MGNIKIPPNTLIAYAAEPGQEASDGPKGSTNGPYAIALKTGLREVPGSAEQIFRFVRQEVGRVTKDKQLPFIEASLTREVFIAEDAMPVPPGQTRGLVDAGDKPNDRGVTIPDGTPRRVALVIGNSNYIKGALTNPANDAKAVSVALKRLGFEPVVEKHDLDYESMRKAFIEFNDLADGADWALVYFAGHGLELEQRGYILPTDAVLTRDTDVEAQAWPISRVLNLFAGTKRLGVFIVDACRNNPFLKDMKPVLQIKRDIVVSNGLPPVEPEDNLLVAYSAKHGFTALDGSGGNSPYVEALMESIEKPGLEIDMMFRMVRDAVRKKTDRKQQPFVYGSLPGESLYFKPPGAEVKATSSATTTSGP